MKLNRTRIDARIPARLLKKLKIVATYKETTATAIIEGALEKGLAWHLKQIAAEQGRDPKQFTWEDLMDVNIREEQKRKAEQESKSQAQDLAEPVSSQGQENDSDEEINRKVDELLDELDAKTKKPRK